MKYRRSKTDKKKKKKNLEKPGPYYRTLMKCHDTERLKDGKTFAKMIEENDSY